MILGSAGRKAFAMFHGPEKGASYSGQNEGMASGIHLQKSKLAEGVHYYLEQVQVLDEVGARPFHRCRIRDLPLVLASVSGKY